MWFNTECEEALNFYTSIFPDSKIESIQRYPEGPLPEPMKGMEGKVLTAVFELFGQRFMALDGGPVFKPTGAVSFHVECQTQEEVDLYWSKLSAGGDPAAQQCGWLADRYGFSWQIIPVQLSELLNDPDKERADRVMQAMLGMKKIDIAGLEHAYKG